jgi:CRISPR-associated protein Csb3
MSTASIPVDLLNPGQVFACIGLAELALVLHGDAKGAFDWSNRRGVRFYLGTSASENPIEAALEFLEAAEVVSLAPEGSNNSTKSWNVETIIQKPGDPFPNADKNGPPQMPARIRHASIGIDITYWGDGLSKVGRDGAKFWAGAGGYPGAAYVRDALDAVRGKMAASHADPFNLAALFGANLRLDKRGSCVPLDAGFSPNNHGGLYMRGFPLVEILAAIGLTHARPQRLDDKLEYRYGVIAGTESGSKTLLPLPLLRAAIGAVPLPFPQRTFFLQLGWAGQEGQARVITSAVEESSQ